LRKELIPMRSIRRVRLGAVLLMIVAVLGIALFKLNYDLGKSARALREARIEREEMLQHTQALRERLSYMQTDDYIMRTARSDLGLILPGEIRYITN